jgi:gas vesicle protein
MNFLLGLMMGAALGLVFAPASGVETRRRLRIKAEEMEQRALATGREKAGEVGREAGERLFDKAVGEIRS